MIIWIRGKRNAGKTTLGRELSEKLGAVLLDGDEMRASISRELGFSYKDRMENNLRVARLAKILERQGFDVVVATICPGNIKRAVYNECKCKFIEL